MGKYRKLLISSLLFFLFSLLSVLVFYLGWFSIFDTIENIRSISIFVILYFFGLIVSFVFSIRSIAVSEVSAKKVVSYIWTIFIVLFLFVSVLLMFTIYKASITGAL